LAQGEPSYDRAGTWQGHVLRSGGFALRQHRAAHDGRGSETGSLGQEHMPASPASKGRWTSFTERPTTASGQRSGPNQEPHGAPDGTDSDRIGPTPSGNKGQGNTGTGGIRDDSRQPGRTGSSALLPPKAGRRQGRRLLLNSLGKETMKDTTQVALSNRSILALFFRSVPT
jgi:hypothetical protein